MTNKLKFITLALAIAGAVGLTVQAVPITHTRTLSGIDYVVAGVSGAGGGSGTITIAGTSGTITKAFLYWHGINNTGTGAVYSNPTVTINGNSVTGVSLGDATTNCWGDGSSRAFEADVTAFVTGDGGYTIAGMSSCAGCNANGASLVVIFDDGNSSNNRDLAFFTGNDSNYANGFPGETDGWHAVLTPIAYNGGPVKGIFHMADGQDFPDNSITFTTGVPTVTIPDDATLWDGISVPTAGTSRAGNGELWDIHTFDITAAFAGTGMRTLNLDGQDPVSDCLGLVLMLLDLDPGSAPPPPTPTPSPGEPSPTPSASPHPSTTPRPTPPTHPTPTPRPTPIPPCEVPPASPTGLTATAVSSSQIDLAWTDTANDEREYRVQRSTNNLAWVFIASLGPNATSYSDTGRAANTTYYYRVRAFNFCGASGFSNTASATTLP